jgi:hypothetical protein
MMEPRGKVGIAAEHKLRQLRERAKWSLPEKLRWLEEAQKLADAITKAPDEARRKQNAALNETRAEAADC